jgi:opacity protein-like surface antigen
VLASRTLRRLASITTAAFLLLHQLPLAAETQLSIYTGTSHTRNSDLRLIQPASGTDLTARDVHWDAHPFRPAPYYGLRLTHFYERHPNWGAALDYTHYKMYAKTDRVINADGTWRGSPVTGPTPLNQYVQRFEISHGVNVLSLNGIYRWLDSGLAAGRLEPYAGVGLAYYRPHAESTLGDVPFETGYQASGFGYQLLAGAQYRINERLGFFLETKFNSGTAKVDIAGGRAETPLRTFHVIGGISFRF